MTYYEGGALVCHNVDARGARGAPRRPHLGYRMRDKAPEEVSSTIRCQSTPSLAFQEGLNLGSPTADADCHRGMGTAPC